jgi:hypothetical protein
MAKLDVGIGEDFPVDEPKPTTQDGESGPKEGEREDCPGVEEWRRRHAEWHRRWRGHSGSWAHWGSREGSWGHFGGRQEFWRALIIIGGIAMLIAIISHFFYFILGAAVLAVLFIMHRNHDDALWDMHPRGSAPRETA